MPDETDPPRKHYGFKEREFRRDERKSSGSRPPITTGELARQAGPVTRSTPLPSIVPKASDPNDPLATLQGNRGVEIEAGADNLEIRPKKTSRRTKDYWLLLLGGNLVIVAGAVFMGGIALVFGFAGVIIYSIGLTWVMWQVMGRY